MQVRGLHVVVIIRFWIDYICRNYGILCKSATFAKKANVFVVPRSAATVREKQRPCDVGDAPSKLSHVLTSFLEVQQDLVCRTLL